MRHIFFTLYFLLLGISNVMSQDSFFQKPQFSIGTSIFFHDYKQINTELASNYQSTGLNETSTQIELGLTQISRDRRLLFEYMLEVELGAIIPNEVKSSLPNRTFSHSWGVHTGLQYNFFLENNTFSISPFFSIGARFRSFDYFITNSYPTLGPHLFFNVNQLHISTVNPVADIGVELGENWKNKNNTKHHFIGARLGYRGEVPLSLSDDWYVTTNQKNFGGWFVSLIFR